MFHPSDPDTTALLLRSGGYAGLALTVFLETGVPVGLLLPGDVLLVSAGVVAARGGFHWVLLATILSAAAIAGNASGYALGRWSTATMTSWISKHARLEQAIERVRSILTLYGGPALVAARFLPGARTLAPMLAGMAGMPARTFMVYNVAGAVVWVWLLTGIGYFAGLSLGQFDHALWWTVAFVVAALLLPIIVRQVKRRPRAVVPVAAEEPSRGR